MTVRISKPSINVREKLAELANPRTHIPYQRVDALYSDNLVTDTLVVDGSTLYVNSVDDRVGIGTDNPQYRLEVRTTTSGNAQIAATSSIGASQLLLNSYVSSGNNGIYHGLGGVNALQIYNAGSERIRIDSQGRVGIGTTAPSGKLHVVKGTSLEAIRVDLPDVAANNDLGLAFQVRSEANLSAYKMGLYATRGTYADTLGWRLTTQAGAGVEKQAIAISKDGNLGIGAAAPANMLHVEGTQPIIRLHDTNTSAYSLINANSGVGALFLEADAGNTVAGSALGFKIDNAEVARFAESGYLGLGTTNPNRKLTINDSSSSYIGHRVADVEKWVSGVDTAGRYIVYNTAVGANSMTFHVDNSVGLGTTNTADLQNSDSISLVPGGATAFRTDGTSAELMNFQVGGGKKGSISATTALFKIESLANSLALASAGAISSQVDGVERFRVDGAGETIVHQTLSVSCDPLDTDAGNLRVLSDANNHAITILENSGGETWQIGVDSSGTLGFYDSTSTTPDLTITDAGNVGIGTSTPSEELDIAASSPAIRLTETDDGAYSNIVYNAGDMFIQVDETNIASGSSLIIDIDGTRVSRIDERGNFGTEAGNGDGYGITFGSNTFNATTTLDWYEEGTWTPVLSDAGVGGNAASLGYVYGHFTRIGNVVHAVVYMANVTTTGMTGSNGLFIQGLPYATKAGVRQGFAFAEFEFLSLDEATEFTPHMFIEGGNTYAELKYNSVGSTASSILVSDISFNAGRVMANFSYLV